MQRPLPPALERIVQWTGVSPARLPFEVLLRWPYIFYRQLRADKAFVRAAGMAYASLVAIVPLLILLFAVFQATGMLGDKPEAIYTLLFGTFFDQIPQVQSFLLPGLMKLNVSALSATGIVALIVVAGRLYLMVEAAYNDIFGVPITRKLGYRLLNFYVTLTAIPLVAALTVASAMETSQLLWLQQWLSSGLRFGLLLGALKAFPCATVRWGPALLGASVSWAGLELAGKGFEWYLVVFASDDPLRVVYGTLGVIPVFLLWLYVIWIMILLGVEVAHVSQNYDSLLQAELEQAMREQSGVRAVTIEVALQVAARVAWHYGQGQGPTSADLLCEQTGLNSRDLHAVLHVLCTCGYFVRTDAGWIPARPPEDIALEDLCRDWREQTVVRGHDAAVRIEIDGLLSKRLGGSLSDGARRWIAPPPQEVKRVTQ